MIDKELFPIEYRAIQKLKETSRRIEEERQRKTQNKLRMIDKWRRKLDGQEHSGRRSE